MDSSTLFTLVSVVLVVFLIIWFLIAYIYQTKRNNQPLFPCLFKSTRHLPPPPIQSVNIASIAKPSPKVLTDAQFDMLPKQTLQKPLIPGTQKTNMELNPCSVCISDICYGDEYVALFPCGHLYHTECIKMWLTTRSIFCPLCKSNVKAGLGIDDESRMVEESREEQFPFVAFPEPVRTR